MRKWLSKVLHHLQFPGRQPVTEVITTDQWVIRQRQEFIKELADGFSRWHGSNEEFAEAYQVLLHNFTRPADKE